jgi:hypothetical protein
VRCLEILSAPGLVACGDGTELQKDRSPNLTPLYYKLPLSNEQDSNPYPLFLSLRAYSKTVEIRTLATSCPLY